MGDNDLGPGRIERGNPGPGIIGDETILGRDIELGSTRRRSIGDETIGGPARRPRQLLRNRGLPWRSEYHG